jgi:hypothetical protein
MRSVAAAAGVSPASVELASGTEPQLLRAAITRTIRGDDEPIPVLARDWAVTAPAIETGDDFLAVVDQLRGQRAETAARVVDGVTQRSSRGLSLGSPPTIERFAELTEPRRPFRTRAIILIRLAGGRGTVLDGRRLDNDRGTMTIHPADAYATMRQGFSTYDRQRDHLLRRNPER